MNMLKVGISVFLALTISQAAHSSNEGRGGGSGCLAEIKSVHHELAVWLAKNGKGLSPAVEAEDFIKALPDNDIVFTDKELVYQGRPIDAYFDGEKISFNCSRFQKNGPAPKRLLIAHEVFRKLHIEGDGYEVSRQISLLDANFGGGDMGEWLPIHALAPERVGTAAQFVTLAPGTFRMGNSYLDNRYYPKDAGHLVTLSKGFEMQRTPVTRIQYLLVMGEDNTSNKRNCENVALPPGAPSFPLRCAFLPATSMNYNDIPVFISRLNELQNDYDYRLPTEAEWEYASRAGEDYERRFWWGNDISQLGRYEWYDKNSDHHSHAVAQKEPNPWGLYDMYGNIPQLVGDCYQPYPEGPVTDPFVRHGCGDEPNRTVARGSWYGDSTESVLNNNGGYVSPIGNGMRTGTISNLWEYAETGFRLVRTARPQAIKNN